jgi:plasmid stability protein
MPDLLVDDIDDNTVEALRGRARRNGRNLEEEVRAILEAAVARARRERILPPNLAGLQAELARRPSSDSTEIVRGMRDGR